MQLKCLASGSKGNCYVLSDSENNMLLLDAGISIKDIKIGIDFKVSNLKGALITHDHQDHAYAIDNLERMGINVAAPFRRKPDKQSSFGSFFVSYFPLTDSYDHFTHTNGDGSECPIYGYLIQHDKEKIRMLYITDTALIKWRFKDIDTLLLGIDYSDEYLELETNEAKKKHIISGHLSLDVAKDFVKVTDRDKTLKNLIIGHLSQVNSNEEKFESKLRKATKCDIHFARKGKVIQL